MNAVAISIFHPNMYFNISVRSNSKKKNRLSVQDFSAYRFWVLEPLGLADRGIWSLERPNSRHRWTQKADVFPVVCHLHSVWS